MIGSILRYFLMVGTGVCAASLFGAAIAESAEARHLHVWPARVSATLVIGELLIFAVVG